MKKLLLFSAFIFSLLLVLSNNGFAQIPTGYGISKATSTNDDEIFNVSLTCANGGTLNNTSTCSTTGSATAINGLAASAVGMYSNYTNLPATNLVIGNTVTGSVKVGFCSSATFPSRFAVYIDYNHDAIFQTNERVYVMPSSATASVSGTTYAFTFTIPTTALSGNTLLRVVEIETTNIPAATGTYSWGETEDYIVNLTNLVNAGADQYLCGITPSVTLGGNPAIAGFTGKYSYWWAANATLSSTTSLHPIATPTVTTTYYFSVLDSTTMQVFQDSVIVFLNQPSVTNIQHSACNNYFFNGQNITTSGIYLDTLLNTNGCDSIISLNLIVSQSTSSNLSATIYSPSVYLFNGKSLSVPGIYYDTLQTSKGCDSILILNLTVLPGSSSSGVLPAGYGVSTAKSAIDDEIFNVSMSCANGGILNNTSNCSITGSAIPLNGLPVSAVGMYSNFTNIPATNLVIGNTVSGSVTVGFCNSATFASRFAVYIDLNRDGIFQTNERVYVTPNSVTASAGGTAYPFTFIIPTNAASGNTLMRVVNIESSNIPAATGTYSWGETEDYIVNLINLVNAGADQHLCGTSSSVTLGGNPAIAGFTGTYSYWWTANASLSSTTNLHPIATPTATTTYYLSVLDSTSMQVFQDSVTVYINQASVTSIQQNACNSFVFNGQTITSNGLYYDTLANVNGCDSIIALQLTINHSVQTNLSASIYSTSSYHFNGNYITAAGTYMDTLTSSNGCDSLLILNLTVIPGSLPQGSVPSGYAPSYATSSIDDEIYNVSLSSKYGGTLNNSSNCSTSGSTVALNNLPASVMTQYSNYTNIPATSIVINDTINASVKIGFCSSATFNSRFAVFIDYNRDGQFLSGETVYVLPTGMTPTSSGTVYSFSFVVPNTAVSGLTLMRIVNTESTLTPTATGTYVWGETEDYLVNIGLSVDAGINKSICSNSSTTLNATVFGGNAPYNYQWLPSIGLSASNILNPIASPTATTTYKLVVTDANGKTGSDSIIVTVNALPTTTYSAVYQSCNNTNSCANLVCGTSSNTTYSWVMSGGTPATSTVSAPTVCYTTTGTHSLTLTVTNSLGCIRTYSDTIKLSTDCVWPGDANGDLVANNLDIFPIGLLNGTTGPVRTNASLVWIDQPAMAYGVSASGYTADAKHADCNGDGIIDGNDTMAIIQNYGLAHLREKSGADLLSVTVGPDTLYQNTTANIAINLGTASAPLDSIYGLAFSFNIDPTAIDTNSISFSVPNSWLFTNSTDHFHICKLAKSATRVDVGLVRNDHISKSGYGNVVNIAIDIITGNIVGKQNATFNKTYKLNCSVDHISILKLDGSTVSANMAHDSSLILYSKPDGIETIHALNLTQLLSPNPANNLVSLKLKGYNLTDEKTVIVLDATGRMMMQQAFTGNQTNINIADLYQGIYVVKVISKNGITESKLIKQ